MNNPILHHIKASLATCVSVVALSIQSNAQPNISHGFIQNFYYSCKPKTFGAFESVQMTADMIGTNQYNRAVRNGEKAISKDSAACDAYTMLAFCRNQADDPAGALELAEKSIRINTANPSGWAVLGVAQFLLADTANAVTSFRNCIQHGPDKIDGYFGLALLQFYQRSYADALTTLETFESMKRTGASWPDKRRLKELKADILKAR